MTFDQAQASGIVNMVEHEPPKPPPFVYRHADALSDMFGQAEAMMRRSWKYKEEAEAEKDLEAGEKHMRVYCVLKELHRLGVCFKDRADETARINPLITP